MQDLRLGVEVTPQPNEVTSADGAGPLQVAVVAHARATAELIR